jgi:type VI secretion system protein ImpF
MAELTQKERLQPSLLDRLTDDDRDQRQESRDKRIISPARLRECVRRDLTWLLNTTHLAALQDLTEEPEIQRSVLNYGIPDFAGRTASTMDVWTMERLITRVIADFEPRLLKRSVKVRVIADAEKMSHNAMCFQIEAELWAQPLPLRLFLRTEIDLESGSVSVAEAGQGG